MSLSKKIETEIWQVYDTWLNSYLNGDVATYDKYLAKDYHFIGSTYNEEFLNKKDTTHFFEATADQLAGKTQLRNETRFIEKFKELIFITHLLDAWFINKEDWAYYGRFRFTSVLQKKEKNWQFIYQHFSTTDSKADEGETIGFDKVAAENQELREAIRRRTFELEQKNRELEVEGALGRIRAQAVAMKTPSDLLDIVVSMRNEFIKLGHQAHYFWHMMWLPDKYEKAMTSGDGSKIGFVMELPRHIHGDIPLLAKWEKSKQATVVYTMNVEEALDYVDKMIRLGDFQNIDPQAPTEEDVRHIGGLTFIMARTTHGEIGYSLPGEVKNPPKEDLDILVKFAGAFDLAHRRFLDLQKTEKQARETEIELALEKVRSRTMAMQKSDELKEVIQVVYDQFVQLNIKIEHTGFIIDYKQEEDMHIWLADRNKIPAEIKIPYFDSPHWNSFIEAKRNGDRLFTNHLGFKEKNKFYRDLFTYIPNIDAETKEYYFTCEGLAISTVLLDSVGLYIENFTGIPYSEEENKILLRFGKVFEQTYIRFLDLQNAEAQAREAQIEAALERVRSRTMGMQRSDELQEAAVLLFQQIVALGVPAFGTGFNIWDDDRKFATAWMAGKDRLQPPFKTSCSEDIFRRILEAEKKGASLFMEEQGGEALKIHYEYMNSIPVFKEIAEKMAVAGQTFPSFQIMHCAFFSQGYLMFISFEHVPESYDIFKRFARVFEQTYTRFLDLQKAEAQTREAQIEAALERVRSKSLAMHKTAELQSVIHTVHQELLNLNLSISGGSFIIINKEIDNDLLCWGSGGTADYSDKIHIPHFEKPFYTHLLNKIKSGPGFFNEEYTNEEKIEFFTFLFQHEPWLGLDSKQKEETLSAPGGYTRSCVVSEHTSIFIINHFGEKFSEDENAILRRFGKVFEQAYTRFLDLQKAEAQAREAQIQLALERVRARTMAMQSSEELAEVSYILNKQVVDLGIPTRGCAFNIYGENESTEWFSNLDGTLPTYKTPRDNIFLKYYQAGQRGETLLIEEFGGERIRLHYKYLMSLQMLGNDEKEEEEILKVMPERQIDHVAYFRYGYLLFITLVPAPEAHEIFQRFSKEFEQTYTRFLDLQKAEAQAREAQIEAALERIRSRSLAMHHSSELSSVVDTLLQEFTGLNFSLTFCIINLIDGDDMSNTVWAANPETGKDAESYYMKFEDYDFHRAMWNAWKAQDKRFVYILEGEEKKIYDEYLYKDTEFRRFPKHVQEANKALERYVAGFTFFKYSGLQTVSLNPITEQELVILERFGNVFEQAYTRFLDLQKAEDQAREARIEAALERVRTQSMLMKHSNEINEISKVFHEQLLPLGVDSEFSFVWLPDEEKVQHLFWATWQNEKNGKAEIQSKSISYPMDLSEPTTLACMADWKSGVSIHEHFIPPAEIKNFFASWEELLRGAEKLKPHNFPEGIYYTEAFMKYGCFGIDIRRPLNVQEKTILNRFAIEFERAYTRFLDLRKAEAQAREGQIEVALERVRASAMSMQSSTDVGKTVITLFEELGNLVGDKSLRCGIGILEGFEKMETWVATLDANEQVDLKMGMLDMTVHPLLKGVKKAWKTKNTGFKYHLVGKDVIDYFTALNKEPDYPVFVNLASLPNEVFHNSFLFGEGVLFAFTHQSLSDEAINILKRFTLVFEHTYTRFLDLQKAEAQVKETIKQASLDRVRGEIASMRSAQDLERITPIIWNELIALRVPFIRCGVFIIQEEEKNVQVYLSAPNGKSLGALSLKIGSSELTDQTVENWRKGRIYKHHWNKEEFIAWTQTLIEQGKVKNFETYQGSEAPPETLDLNFVPFKQGMLYVGNIKPLDEEAISLVSALAETFAIAYARYEDFSQLEKAKRSLELTLAELKAAQSQLIQSEKMASLGELTAGIAHEIQNPLNFVNNFSEVSKELIEELNEERIKQKGERDEALEDEILSDIQNNLDKINHHGQRASAIVKGMLQHSRSSEGHKEPTDINDLADEYLRLAYHGLRAKDKSFNADFKTDFDTSIPKIEVVPQDLGRVLLNLINNAFYAVNQKARTGIEGHRPEVVVRTRRTGNEVEISVKDNGSGIPEHIKEKIFQPFFTTKPTGQGTGLGLSLSYDIVKAHGGILEVESPPKAEKGDYRNGSLFTIKLPLKKPNTA